VRVDLLGRVHRPQVKAGMPDARAASARGIGWAFALRQALDYERRHKD
jgi:hypothetical protein